MDEPIVMKIYTGRTCIQHEDVHEGNKKNDTNDIKGDNYLCGTGVSFVI